MAMNIPITYSASCLPPKEVLNHQHGNTVQRYNIKFPTFFGQSVGFIKLNDSWKTSCKKSRFSKSAQSVTRIGQLNNQNKIKYNGLSERDKLNAKLNISNFKLNIGRHADKNMCVIRNSLERPRETECHSLHRRVSGSAYPLSFHPRIHSRSYSQPRYMQSDSTDFSKLYSFGETETNCNNCLAGKKNPEWIELFFEFPNGTRQRFHMRYQAIFKNAIRAFSARMGYKSINDLVFVTMKNKSIFINDTPKSIGLRDGDIIKVSNFNFGS